MFASLIQYLLNNGVPEYTLYLLLALPLVTTLITFSRYVVGWKSLNIYTSVLMVYALLEISHVHGAQFNMMDGLTRALILIAPITLLALFLQRASGQMRMHYMSKVSIITTLVSIGVLGMLYVATELSSLSFMLVHPMSFIILIVVLDLFVKSYIRKGPIKSVKLILNTLGLAFAVSALMGQSFMQSLLFSFPEITLYSLVADVLLGRWTGLRLSEYFRFKDINIKSDDDIQHNSQ